MTCEKAVINGPNSKKLAQKKQIGKSGGERKTNPSANPVLRMLLFLILYLWTSLCRLKYVMNDIFLC